MHSELSKKKTNSLEINTSDGKPIDQMSMESRIEKELLILSKRKLLNLTVKLTDIKLKALFLSMYLATLKTMKTRLETSTIEFKI